MLAELALRDQPVALIVADQRMPRDDRHRAARAGARRTRPAPSCLLLTAYADTDVAIKAINDIGLDYYLLKPWDPPEERLYPVVDDLLDDWRQANPDQTSDVRVVGHRWSDRSHEIKTFLARNHVPYRWHDVERDAEAPAAARARRRGAGRPAARARPRRRAAAVAVDPRRWPTRSACAPRAEQPLYDLCIVGGGPAGLAAAVYAASEGLQHRRRRARGAGRAGRPERGDRELPRLPEGADRRRPHPPGGRPGVPVRRRDGARPRRRRPRDPRAGARRALRRRRARSRRGRVHRGDRRVLPPARGRRARRAHRARRLLRRRPPARRSQCEGDDVYVVGAANSAGQAALNLARYAKRVVLVVRGRLARGRRCRSYLVERIDAAPNIEVRLPHRGRRRRAATATSRRSRSPTGTTGAEEEVPASWLFVFIGASPRTDWLGDGRRPRRAGASSSPARTCCAATQRPAWPLARPPFALETSVPGVFAAGDVRLDSMKRVASAVGEGAMSVYLVHRYLATI